MTTRQCSSDFSYSIDIPVGDIKKEPFNILASKETNLTTPSIVCIASTKQGLQRREFDTIKTCEYSDDPSEYVKGIKDIIDEDDIILIRPNGKLEPDNPDPFIDKDISETFRNIKEFYKL